MSNLQGAKGRNYLGDAMISASKAFKVVQQ